MPELPFPVLVADVGGTNSRFAIVEEPGGMPGHVWRTETTAFATVDAALAAARRALAPASFRSAMLAIAGRVGQGVPKLTNGSWTFDPEAIGRTGSLSGVTVLNDYLPVAAAVGVPGRAGLVTIGKPQPASEGPTLACGPGTGFGAALARPVGDLVVLEPTEAGHMDFGACDPEEFAIWPRLDRVRGRITAESVLAGPGLVRLYRALCVLDETGTSGTTAADVAGAARAGDPSARRAVEEWARLLGRFVGDLALLFGATGGVFLSGGIAPRLIDVLEGGAFRNAFERKAPFADLMMQIPTHVVVEPDPALSGLARIASAPGRFLFTARHWRA
ncbi:glucokinase [Alsobacter sp. R-9]